VLALAFSPMADNTSLLIGAGVALLGYDYISNRGKKKSWRIPFWESVGVVDILVYPALIIICTPFIFNSYSRVKKVFSVQRNKPYMQQLKSGLTYFGMEEDFTEFLDPSNAKIQHTTDDAYYFGALVVCIAILGLFAYPNKLLGTDEEKDVEESDSDDEDDVEHVPTRRVKREKKEKKEKSEKKAKKAYEEDVGAPADSGVLDRVQQKKKLASKVQRKLGKDYYGDQNKIMG